MHRIEANTAAAGASRPLADEADLSALGPGVGTCPVVVAGAVLEVVEVERLRVLATRGHRDDARPGRPPHQRQEPADEDERSDDHRRHGRLDAIRADGPLGEDRAGVVDEDIQARFGRQDPHRRGTDGREGCHVRHDHRKAVRAVAHEELVSDGRQSLSVTSDQHDPCPERRELVGGLASQPGGRSGDEGRPACQGVRWWRRPAEQASPDGGSDPREAADDRDFEEVVDDGPWLELSRQCAIPFSV